MTIKIAFIGAAGVPNNYGGFEMFMESCAPELAKRFKRVFITCDSKRYKDKDQNWQNVRRVFINISANGPFSVVHDLVAFFSVFFRVDLIIVLGVSGGIFFPLFKLMCACLNKKLIVNVDGIEWRREKFSRSRRWFLYLSDRLAQCFAHQVIVDNEALRPFLIRSIRTTAKYIPYPGDQIIRTNIKHFPYKQKLECLTICRIEPENNCHLLIDAFARRGQGHYIFIGNWNASEYGRELRTRYKEVPGLEMRDPTYDKELLTSLREDCTIYLHGHSVGGTNPSLVEILFYDCNILAFDCTFNRSTAGDGIQYFCNEEELVTQLRSIELNVCRDRTELRSQYTRTRVCDAYSELINGLFRLVIPPQNEGF